MTLRTFPLAVCALVLLMVELEARCLTPSMLGGVLDPLVRNGTLSRSQVGVYAAYLSSSSTGRSSRAGKETSASWTELYEYQSGILFTPASNGKVLTTAAAYLELGSNFTFSTQLLANSSSSTSAETVCVVAGGDPSLTWSQVADLVRTLPQKRGIRSVQRLVVDDTLFTGPPFPGSWEWGDLWYGYGAQPTASAVDENTFTFTVAPASDPLEAPRVTFENPAAKLAIDVENLATTGAAGSTSSVQVGYRFGFSSLFVTGSIALDASPKTYTLAVPRPSLYLLNTSVYNLQAAGVEVRSSYVGPCPISSAHHLVQEIKSAPLSTLMNHTLQYSDNLYAELFLHTLGAHAGVPSGSTTASAGVAAIQAILGKQGVDSDYFMQVDGSGLSRHNLVANRALIETFEAMLPHKEYTTFLPVGGQSGTLKYRFRGTSAEGIVHAKTGTETGVNSLSGYVLHTDSEFAPIVFSVLTNSSPFHASTVRAVIDEMVVALADLRMTCD